MRKPKFNKLKNNKNIIHYDTSYPDMMPKDNSGKISNAIDWFYNRIHRSYDIIHWFYDPRKDIFYKFCRNEEFAELDFLFEEPTNIGNINVSDDMPIYFFEYKNNTFSLTDPTRQIEKMIMLAIIARLKYLGLSSVKLVKLSKPTALDLSYKLKFKDEADYAFFKLKFHEYIEAYQY